MNIDAPKKNKPLKIAFIYTTDDYVTEGKPIKSFSAVPFGISYLSSFLKEESHTTDLLVLPNGQPMEEKIKSFIDSFQPDLYCMTSVASQFRFISEAASIIRKVDSSKFIILGGHHASLCSDVCIEDPAIDAICIGEGEIALQQYASQVALGQQPTGISNLWIKMPDGSIEKNGQRVFNEGLDQIPFPDREMWDRWVLTPEERPSVLISRGCPYKCTYCANHAMAKLAEGKYTRYRPPQHIVSEIKVLIARYPKISEIYLEAETFGADLKMTFAISEALAEFNKTLENPIKFSANFTLIKRISSNIELLETLQRANFTGMNVGLESGSERLRNGYLKRPPYLNSDLIQFVGNAKKYGIDVIFFALMGLPTETLEDYYETVRVCRAAQPYDDLYRVSQELNLIEKNPRYGYERSQANLNLPDFPSKALHREYIWFYYKVYKGQRPFMAVMAKVLRNYLMTKPRLNTAFNHLSNLPWLYHLKKRFRFSKLDSKVQSGGSRRTMESALG
jgi:anaerobic magnesium-protoporphyrin IX monomethyl ester cyclase